MTGTMYNDNTLLFAYLKSVLLLQDFSLRFVNVCAFFALFLFGLVFFFFFVFFFAHLHIMKSSKKKTNLKITTVYKNRSNKHIIVLKFFFRLSREKSI